MVDQHTDAVGRCIHGVFTAFDHGKAGCRRHFNDGCFTVGQSAVKALDICHARAFDGNMDLFTTGRRQHGIDGTFAAVGHRDADDLTVREAVQGRFLHNITYIQRRYGALKGIGRQNNFLHVDPSSCRISI